MNKVWLVTKGEYSDYHVVAVYGDEESARAAQKAIDGYEGDDDQGFEVRPKGFMPSARLAVYTTFVRTYDGSIAETKTGEYTEVTFDDCLPCEENVTAYVPDPRFAYPGSTWRDKDTICIRIEGTDHDRVRKVYSEQRAMALAHFDVLVEHERINRRVSLNLK